MIAGFIGLPYDLHNISGYNCFALVGLVYSELFGQSVPVFTAKTNSPRDIAATFASAFATGEHGFKKTDKPKDFDVIVFKKKTRFGYVFHCGILYKNKVLHASSSTKSSTYQSVKMAGEGFEEIEYWQR